MTRVFITGGASGLGRALAEAYALDGAKVCIGDINAERCAETVAALKALGAEAHALPCNVTDEADLVATVRWGNEWDVAAAHLVAQEAGAVVTDALGNAIVYNKREPLDFGLICCAPGIHAAAVDRLAARASSIKAPSS